MDGNVDLYNINKKCICNAIQWQTHKAQHSVAPFGHDCVKGYISSRYIYFFTQHFSLYTFIGCIRLYI